jgi:uncharacterized protein
LNTRALVALLLSDGKAGHYHQAEGVLAALARVRRVETMRLEVRRRFIVPTRTLLQLVNAGAPPATVLRLGYALERDALPAADVVVSAGGETLAANAAAAALLGIPNVFCGRLRRLNPDHVRLIIVSLERFATHSNYLVALPPSPIEPPRPGSAQPPPPGPPRVIAVLVGGDSGALRYTAEDWSCLTRFLREAHAAHGTRWLATTSRRSGAGIGDALAAMAADASSGIARFIDYRTAGPGTLGEFFAQADAILVTDDSTTMISEAVGARLPVVSVSPANAQLEEREAEYRSLLASNGWLRTIPLPQLTPPAFLAALAEITPRQTSPLDELAADLKQRLPQLFADA